MSVALAPVTFAALAERSADRSIDLATFETLAGNADANTKLSYMYRDADNYKQWKTVVLPGAITAEELETILDHLDEDGFFVPGQVGLDDLQGEFGTGWDDQSDHPFHSLTDVELTLEDSDIEMTPTELARLFSEVSWDQEHRP